MHYFGSFSINYRHVWSILLASDHFSKKSVNIRMALDYVFVFFLNQSWRGGWEKFLSLSVTFDGKSKSLIPSQAYIGQLDLGYFLSPLQVKNELPRKSLHQKALDDQIYTSWVLGCSWKCILPVHVSFCWLLPVQLAF